MNQFMFLLGKASDLSFEELKVVLAQYSITPTKISNQHAISKIEKIDANELIDKLGGTVKIAKILSKNPENDTEVILKDLKTFSQRPNFSVIGASVDINHQIKSSLRDEGISSRFVLATDIYATATSQQKNYHEYWKVIADKNTYITKAVAFQNISDWGKRDYQRPRVDPKSGMLPPKIARILVNLAVPTKTPSTLYDPFCGSGTILSEAMMLGHTVIGSDISQKAIDDSDKNLKWLSQNYQIDGEYHLFNQDVAHVTKEDLGKEIDAIAFEPYMGPSHISQEKVKNIAKGLEKLYIGALKNCAKLLPSGGKMVAIFPQFRFGNVVKTTDNLIDRCENFGYTRQAGPLTYDRPSSTVVRRIYILVKN